MHTEGDWPGFPKPRMQAEHRKIPKASHPNAITWIQASSLSNKPSYNGPLPAVSVITERYFSSQRLIWLCLFPAWSPLVATTVLQTVPPFGKTRLSRPPLVGCQGHLSPLIVPHPSHSSSLSGLFLASVPLHCCSLSLESETFLLESLFLWCPCLWGGSMRCPPGGCVFPGCPDLSHHSTQPAPSSPTIGCVSPLYPVPPTLSPVWVQHSVDAQ